MQNEPNRRGNSMARTEAHAGRVLVVDDTEGVRLYVANCLSALGYASSLAESGPAAIEALQSGERPDLVLLDIMMPDMDGLETLRRIREMDSDLPVVMVSVVGRAPTIVEAMHLGASDFVNKPFEQEELGEVLLKVIGTSAATRSNRGFKWEEDSETWTSPAMSKIGEVLDQISDTNVTVLIQGESGVGKEIVARAIHQRSTRADGPFVKVNCAALPEDLLESELFGYEKGAFTGSLSRKFGKFEVASGGTIFLDEIGEMSPALQAKLLQVLQDSQFTRLGGNREVTVDVRVVCATHRPLLSMVADKSFREDLYFRLNVVNIQIPPLRHRRDEIPSLIGRFLARYSAEYGRPYSVISEELQRTFRSYGFPGNVRELENMVKRIVVLGSESSILKELASSAGAHSGKNEGLNDLLSEIEETAGDIPLREVGKRVALEVEREAIEVALEQTGSNRKQAALLLGVSYKTLLQKIRDCQVEVL